MLPPGNRNWQLISPQWCMDAYLTGNVVEAAALAVSPEILDVPVIKGITDIIICGQCYKTYSSGKIHIVGEIR
jgi:hypothetical protein